MSHYKEVVSEISSNMRDLNKQIPDVMKNFASLVAAGSAEGVLDQKTKELIAIAIAVAKQCDGCIGFHTKKLVELGVTEEELIETLGVAIFMGGGPAVMYAANTVAAFKEFSK